jgi:RNA polymerase sigma-70 factor (ECF subfamily)
MEKSIILAASQGDKNSFKMIFEYYLPRMRPVALRYARSSFESEDILQDSFLKVYNKLTTYSFQGEFEGWIKAIVINTALNHYKKNKNTYSSERIESISDANFEMEEEEDHLKEMDSDSILEAISELPEGYKVVFNLYVFEGHSHKVIAEMLGISEVTSRTQFFKARGILKKIITQATK